MRDVSRPALPPMEANAVPEHPFFVRGLHLFQHGYYWEAHEEWETLWNAIGRRGSMADLLKCLIQVCAAGIKLRQKNQEAGERLLVRAKQQLSNLDGLHQFTHSDLSALRRWLDDPGAMAIGELDGRQPVQVVFSNSLPPLT